MQEFRPDPEKDMPGRADFIRKIFTAGTEVEMQEKLRESERLERQRGMALTKEQRVGRNDPCPCGSGKKFKKCHLERWG